MKKTKKITFKKSSVQLKKRFKMYKAKKRWVYAPILFIGLMSGFMLGGEKVSANEIDKNLVETQTTSAESKTSMSTLPTENDVDIDTPDNKEDDAKDVTQSVTSSMESTEVTEETEKNNISSVIDQNQVIENEKQPTEEEESIHEDRTDNNLVEDKKIDVTNQGSEEKKDINQENNEKLVEPETNTKQTNHSDILIKAESKSETSMGIDNSTTSNKKVELSEGTIRTKREDNSTNLINGDLKVNGKEYSIGKDGKTIDLTITLDKVPSMLSGTIINNGQSFTVKLPSILNGALNDQKNKDKSINIQVLTSGGTVVFDSAIKNKDYGNWLKSKFAAEISHIQEREKGSIFSNLDIFNIGKDPYSTKTDININNIYDENAK